MRTLILASLLAAACGGESQNPPGGADAPDADPSAPDAGAIAGRLLPLASGASWTYRVTDTTTGATADKTSTVGAEEDVGGAKAGVIAFRVTTEKLDGMTVSWQEDIGTAIVRHRERSFDAAGGLQTDEIYTPHKLRVDDSPAHRVAGATWTEAYTEDITDAAGQRTSTTKTETWSVEAVDDTITVPAGTFTCVRVRKTSQTTASNKVYWFAPGVGKVREAGMASLEELTAYSLP